MNIGTLILVISNLTIFFVGLFTLYKNTRSSTNRLFALLSLALICWTTANYVSITPQDSEVVFSSIKLVFTSVVVQNTAFYLFVSTFPLNKIPIRRKPLMIYLASGFVVALAALTGVIFKGYTLDAGVFKLEPSPLIVIFILHALFSIVGGFVRLFRREKKAGVVLKNQLMLLFIASIVLMMVVPLTNFLLPAVFKVNSFVKISPIYTLVFASVIAYAIVKQKLFDIKAVVARSVAYVAMLMLLIAAYGIGLFGISTLIFGADNNVNTSEFALYTTIAIVLALSFPRIKQLVDRLTNKIFFRDYYDTQEVISSIGDVIVGSISTTKIKRGAVDALRPALKPDYIAFLMLDQLGSVRQDDLQSEFWKAKTNKPLQQVLHGLKKEVIVYEQISEKDHHLKDILREEDIGLIAPLVTKKETVGYLVAGSKKSGSIYTDQDTELIKIVSNELAVALQNAQRFEEIQAFNLTLQEKVDEATKELKKTNKKLIELDEAKDEFISMASHQLRTPLTSIKGYISMLLDGDMGKFSKEQDQALKEAFTSSQRMVFLISDFLNVSRIKTGKFVIDTKEVDLSEMVKQELVQLKEMAESKNLKMVYDAPAKFPKVKLDENKMHQVMMNMMDNAIYYTPKDGKITTQLYVDGKDVVFKVIDTGIGVPKAEQHKLFSKFFRAGNAKKTRPDGTGLGLFMAQKVVVAQGGAVIFESVEGKGSTFGFRFPLSKIKA
jgi:signal transduction histidine kinase